MPHPLVDQFRFTRSEEIQAIRQILGHPDLAEYVGDIEAEAPYRPE